MPSDRKTSLVGLFILMFAGWIVSRDRRRINIRLIVTGLLLQSTFALLVFTLPAGTYIFSWLNDAVLRLISFPNEGISFLFGPLAVAPGTTGLFGLADFTGSALWVGP